MKILFISGGDYKYGAPKSMMTMIESLRELYGIEAILLTKKKNVLNDYCDQHGIENYSFWYRDIMAGSPYTNKFLTIAKHLVKYLACIWGGITMQKVDNLPIDFSTIDIIHTNTNRQDLGVYLASKYHIKHVWHIREMGQEDYNVIFYKKNCIRCMNSNADAFIMISNVVKKKWCRMGISPRKSYTLYDGMETAKTIKHIGSQDNRIRIVITGHVQPNKGQLDLVKAVSKLPVDVRDKVELDIIGEAYPDYRKIIESEIEKAGMQKQIHLLGYMDNLNQLLSEYDIGVTCSKAEGLGRCTVEYMLAGLLTIASDTGANPEIIDDRATGMLYKYGNIDDLSHTIAWSIAHPEECKKMMESGTESAKSMFSKEQYAKNLYRIYNQILL